MNIRRYKIIWWSHPPVSSKLRQHHHSCRILKLDLQLRPNKGKLGLYRFQYKHWESSVFKSFHFKGHNTRGRFLPFTPSKLNFLLTTVKINSATQPIKWRSRERSGFLLYSCETQVYCLLSKTWGSDTRKFGEILNVNAIRVLMIYFEIKKQIGVHSQSAQTRKKI